MFVITQSVVNQFWQFLVETYPQKFETNTIMVSLKTQRSVDKEDYVAIKHCSSSHFDKQF